jgi:hypothetical protein
MVTFESKFFLLKVPHLSTLLTNYGHI